jgi:hypothetical protein
LQDVRVDPVTGQQFGDLIEFCDFNFINRVAKVNGVAMFSLAAAPGTYHEGLRGNKDFLKDRCRHTKERYDRRLCPHE